MGPKKAAPKPRAGTKRKAAEPAAPPEDATDFVMEGDKIVVPVSFGDRQPDGSSPIKQFLAKKLMDQSVGTVCVLSS